MEELNFVQILISMLPDKYEWIAMPVITFLSSILAYHKGKNVQKKQDELEKR